MGKGKKLITHQILRAAVDVVQVVEEVTRVVDVDVVRVTVRVVKKKRGSADGA